MHGFLSAVGVSDPGVNCVGRRPRPKIEKLARGSAMFQLLIFAILDYLNIASIKILFLNSSNYGFCRRLSRWPQRFVSGTVRTPFVQTENYKV